MRRHMLLLVAAILVLGLAAEHGEAARVQVVASIPDLKALTEAVGGDLVEVDTLARGAQNPHDIEVRPSLMLKLRRADLLVRNGAGGDPWVEPLLLGAQNSRIVPGTPGYVDASQGVAIIPPTGPVDRSRGDVHPEGNPHYTLDPVTATVVTQNIVDGLARVSPAQSEQFAARRRDFLTRLNAAVLRWQQTMEPVRGAKIVTYHEIFTYFLRRFGLEQAGVIEDRPGIPPSPTHLANLIRTIREQQVKAIMAESFADQKVVALVARESGARAVPVPASVDGVKGVQSYMDLFDHLVKTLAEALR
jgi:zinc/manganese transport system substrate-binding protein